MDGSTVGSVVIRFANGEDFDWVSDLMDRTLGPFYDGDHRAHAKRILDTHVSGGTDLVGHFSTGQHMLIAEVNGVRAGLIHVVDKKQSTVKISPLIVLEEFRGYGVGKALLDYVEQYAIEQGARQLYCTVASPNVGALGFFQGNGFRVTGTAKDHYKRNVDERMLYKQLGDTGLSVPSKVAVVPFNHELHADAVRRLILSRMQSDFMGVDDTWVDALYEGCARQGSGDVNEKYKIIFVATNHGEVTGVVGATPKKGCPIKLMPLLASDEASFEALIVDVKGLLMSYGHKLYVHLVPEAWQIACLHRHGWELEGVFPEGYSPNSIVQQWGYHLPKGNLITRTMRIDPVNYRAIMAGNKTLELRLGDDYIKACQVGDLIKLETSWSSGLVRINAIRPYFDFWEVVKNEEYQQIVLGVKDMEAAFEELQAQYPLLNGSEIRVFVVEPVTVRSRG